MPSAGDAEQAVAQGLELEATRPLPPEQVIVGVAGEGVRLRRAALLPGRRRHDVALQRLDRPAVRDEPRREVVEQFGVRGPFAGRAEVIGRGDEPAAKMLLPDAVDDHARVEGIARAGESPGERAAAIVGEGAVVDGCEQLREAARMP